MNKESDISFLIIFSAFFNKKAKILIFPSFSSYLLENKQSYRISNRIKSFSHTHLHAQRHKNRIANAQTLEMHSCTYPYDQHTQNYGDNDTGFNKSVFCVRI